MTAAKVIEELQQVEPETQVEVLTPFGRTTIFDVNTIGTFGGRCVIVTN